MEFDVANIVKETATLPTYDEIVEAIKITHNLYLRSLRGGLPSTDDMERILNNQSILDRFNKNGK